MIESLAGVEGCRVTGPFISFAITSAIPTTSAEAWKLSIASQVHASSIADAGGHGWMLHVCRYGYTDVPQQSEVFVTEMLETVRDMLYATLREYILHSSSLQQLFPPPPGEPKPSNPSMDPMIKVTMLLQPGPLAGRGATCFFLQLLRGPVCLSLEVLGYACACLKNNRICDQLLACSINQLAASLPLNYQIIKFQKDLTDAIEEFKFWL